MLTENQVGKILAATAFAAAKHRNQRRKDREKTPYINHPLAVMQTLWDSGGIRDPDILCAAVLHDTIEDTNTSEKELEGRFGPAVASLVLEVSDDKSLPKTECKKLQIEGAAGLSRGAKQIRLADKISNVADMGRSPPEGWSLQKTLDYIEWTGRVIDRLRGINSRLEDLYDATVAEARKRLSESV